MHGINYSGGANKTHGQVEQADRIDSFEAGKVQGRGWLIACRGRAELPLVCEHHQGRDREAVRLSYPGSRWSAILELSRAPSGFGGSRAFWLCPSCGRRTRFLYFNGNGRGFLCRGCAKLNYRSQQRTRDSINHVRDGLSLARERLRWEPSLPVVPMDFPHVTPPCPRYMHQTTYQQHLARFRQYQEKYQRDSMREMLAVLRRLR